MNNVGDVLDYLNTIHPLTPACREYLLTIIQEKTLLEGDYFLKPNQISRQICFIKSGLTRSYYFLGDGKEVSSWFQKKGDFSVSILSFYQQIPSFEYIRALKTTEIFLMSYDQLHHAYRNYMEFNFIGRELTISYLVSQAWQLYCLRLKNAEERYRWLLEHHPELILEVPQKYIASYLDVTEVTVSRIKRKIARQLTNVKK